MPAASQLLCQHTDYLFRQPEHPGTKARLVFWYPLDEGDWCSIFYANPQPFQRGLFLSCQLIHFFIAKGTLTSAEIILDHLVKPTTKFQHWTKNVSIDSAEEISQSEVIAYVCYAHALDIPAGSPLASVNFIYLRFLFLWQKHTSNMKWHFMKTTKQRIEGDVSEAEDLCSTINAVANLEEKEVLLFP